MEELTLRRTHLFLALIIASLAVGLVPANAPGVAVQAQDVPQAEHYAYLPVLEYKQTWQFEPFTTDPGWYTALLKDPTDGFFEQSPETQTYWGYIEDNSALMVAWPGWRVRGDYKIEVDARHVSPLKKSFNALGVVFNATDNFEHFHALMLAAGGAQHFWAVTEFTDTRASYLTNGGYRGGTNFMRAWDNWNNLEIRVVDGTIYALCNDKWLPNGSTESTRLFDDRLVGLVVTSYEFSNGVVEFDNFKLTPLYPGDPDYEEVIQRREALAALDALDEVQFDTPPLDLHK
jgi:hypothetical protein